MNLLVLLTVIYNSGYYFSTTYVGSSISIMLLGCSILILLFKKDAIKSGLTYNEFFILLLFVIAILGSELINGRMLGQSSLKNVFVVILALYIAKTVPWTNFKRIFVKTMVIVSVLAIIGEVVSTTSVISRLPNVRNYNNVEYVSGYFFAKINYEYIGLSNRMQGLFWEPGLFATYLVLSILLCEKEMFSKRMHYYGALILFVISIVLTLSGAGLLMIPIALIAKILKKKNISIYTLVFFTILMIGIVYVLIARSEFLEKYLFSKLLDDENISNYTRWNAFWVDLKVFVSSFPFGVGNTGYAAALKQYHGEAMSSGTSTLTSYLAYYGVAGIIIAIVWLRSISKINKNESIISRIATTVLMLLILSKEPHEGLLFMNCVFMYHTFYINRDYIGDKGNESEVKKNCYRQGI